MKESIGSNPPLRVTEISAFPPSNQNRAGTLFPRTDKKCQHRHYLHPPFPRLSPAATAVSIPCRCYAWINQSAVENGNRQRMKCPSQLREASAPALPLQCVDGTRTGYPSSLFGCCAKPSSYLPRIDAEMPLKIEPRRWSNAGSLTSTTVKSFDSELNRD